MHHEFLHLHLHGHRKIADKEKKPFGIEPVRLSERG